MIKFNPEEVDMYLSVVRKYMQLRGGLSQKELAIKINVGISTMSRFLNQKTKELDAQLIANIVAKLQIPLHEMIDFVEEDSTNMFKKLVLFYKEDEPSDTGSAGITPEQEQMDGLEEGLDDTSTRTTTTANIRGVKVPFGTESRRTTDKGTLSIKEKLNQLSPRQKGFLTDFLDLDSEGRDLIVDVGNSLYRYFKQTNAEF